MNDNVTAYYQAQAKHDSRLNRLSKKILAKWKAFDHAAIKATREARDLAVAALSSEERHKHYLPKSGPIQLESALTASAVAESVAA